MKLRRFNPLPKDHPAVGDICPCCNRPLNEGDMVTLIPYEITDPHIAKAHPAHITCAIMLGYEIEAE